MDTSQFNYYFIFLQRLRFLTSPFFLKFSSALIFNIFLMTLLLSFLVSLQQPLKNWSLPRFCSQHFTYLIRHTLPWVISSMHKLQLVLQMMTSDPEAHISTCICQKLMTSNWPKLTSSFSLSQPIRKIEGKSPFVNLSCLVFLFGFTFVPPF